MPSGERGVTRWERVGVRRGKWGEGVARRVRCPEQGLVQRERRFDIALSESVLCQ